MNRRGSFTVEAAFLMPFFLLMLSGIMMLGIDLYQEVKEESSNDKTYWAVEEFFKYQMLKEVLENDS